MTEPNRRLVEWTAGMNPQEKDSFLELLNNAPVLIERIRAIIQRKLETLEATEVSNDNFDKPGWDYRNANQMGQKRVLKDLQALFTI